MSFKFLCHFIDLNYGSTKIVDVETSNCLHNALLIKFCISNGEWHFVTNNVVGKLMKGHYVKTIFNRERVSDIAQTISYICKLSLLSSSH